jgi:hypothetical protein
VVGVHWPLSQSASPPSRPSKNSVTGDPESGFSPMNRSSMCHPSAGVVELASIKNRIQTMGWSRHGERSKRRWIHPS